MSLRETYLRRMTHLVDVARGISGKLVKDVSLRFHLLDSGGVFGGGCTLWEACSNIDVCDGFTPPWVKGG